MAFNTELEELIDALLADKNQLIKKKMFGGVGYLTNGNMCFGIHKDFLVVRTTTEQAEDLLREEGILPFDITGRAMAGWVMIQSDRYGNKEDLQLFLQMGLNFANSLPPK